ncbi:MAG: TraB/GumN family protein [Rufibacter sp.]
MNSYKGTFFWFLLLSLTAGILFPVTAFCGVPEVSPKSLLWKVSGKGIKTSYLYGTFHLVPKDQFVLPSKVKQKMVKSQTVVFEVDLESPELTRSLSKAMVMQKPLNALMSVQDYNMLSQFVHDTLQRSMEPFKFIKPGFLGQLLLYPKLLGYNPESYDLALLKLAHKWHKSIYVLETPQEQVALLDQANLEAQTNQLLNSVKQFDRQRRIMKQMLSLYQQENLQGLYNLITSQENEKESQALMLDNRNQKWMTPLVNMMHKSPSFIAVGAAHLPGEQGLIQLLKNKGYKVEPVFD